MDDTAPNSPEHPKTSTNPKGAGRPKKQHRTSTEPLDPETEAALSEAEKMKKLDLTPTVCRELAKSIAATMAIGYSVAARVFDDPRWNLTEPEFNAQTHLISVGLMVYGDEIKGWVVPVVLMTGLSGPLIARLLLPPLKRSEGGAPVPPKPDAVQEAA